MILLTAAGDRPYRAIDSRRFKLGPENLGSARLHGGGRSPVRTPLRQPVIRLTVLSQNLNPDILMMQPAKDWNRCDASGLLRAPKVRSIFIQRKMGPNFVVI
jgi:hypothetical protein